MNKSILNTNYNHIPFNLLRNKAAVLIISILMLTVGILGIIEHKTPENLASWGTLGYSIIVYIEYHLLIIAGALGITHFIAYLSKQE